MFNTDILDNETESQYLWRIGQAKENGILNMTWNQVADLMNSNFREDESEYRTESAYRKAYASAKKFNTDVFQKSDRSEELDAQLRELERQKIKFRDYKRSWNKQNYEASRFDEVIDILEERLDNFSKQFDIPEDIAVSFENDAMICCLSDLHIGQTFSSTFGEYNSSIAKDRMEKYLLETIKIGKLHGVNRVYLFLLGDNISNALHKTLEVTNKENVIDQMKLSIEYITSFAYELTKYFNVYLASASGNHSRLQAKDLAQHSERLDAFIAWDVCRVLEMNNPNFHSLLHRSIDDGISDVSIDGKSYLLVHGDYDTPDKNGYMRLSTMCGFFPENIFCGHKHFCFYNQENHFIQSGSLASTGDDYTIEKRLSGKASQMICIVNKNGIKACYPVLLS